jgi:glyoxylase-like metal-dependent hydrolase (beta-lactamase superfamily II)
MPALDGLLPDRGAAMASSRIEPFSGDHDVVQGGTVRMISTASHTPGYQSLLLRLWNGGSMLLLGDVAHYRNTLDKALIPTGTESSAETVAAIGAARYWPLTMARR